MIVNCKNCNKEFVTVPARIKMGKGKCCSRECHLELRKSYIDTAKKAWETRRKNGNNVPYNKGKKSPETTGNGNPAWVGGRWKYWKTQALLRDQYICQKCGYREDEIMQVDHILPRSKYPELEYDLNNLQTLCPNCHMRKSIKERKRAA